ncbi:MAG TPA: translation initiation factor IF-2 subunit beta [Candidatus Nanoarchaeia archaeon]|nr:translation initiation factor IF-2 subunit beta [Candidatus Nanoarchaeia archaeon]
METEYESLLEKAYTELPETTAAKSERFEIPHVRGHIQGNKTVISNFSQIVSTLGREPEHLLKFVLRELATPGELANGLLIIGTKVSASRINEKIDEYTKEFVLCNECGKPDTKLIKENGLTYKKCMACGSKTAIKSRI